jgi:hypothetical protein
LELAIYFSDLDRLFDIDEALRVVDPNTIPSHFQTVIFGDEPSSKEYYANLVSLTWLDLLTSRGVEFSRLYFGQEFCEHLIATPEETEQAFFYARQLAWDFTYVTGTVPDAGLDATRNNLARLAEAGHDGEVVVNDWGVLRVLRREFPTMQPVLGRLLTKQKRMVRYNKRSTPPPVYTIGIEAREDQIRRNQIDAYRDTSLANDTYRRHLRDLGFVSVDLDIVPQGIRPPEGGWDIPRGFYYPWGYAACGRNCPTAALVEPLREHVVVDGPCPRPCRQFNVSRDLIHYPEITIQRGNTLFVFHGEYAQPYFDGRADFERLIFQPYIPI